MSENVAQQRLEPAVRVSTLELFFDLVFVFTFTQLTAVLADDISRRGIIGVLLMAGVILWMYGGYAWLTNAVAPSSRFRRTLMLVGMGSFLALALAIPEAFGPAGWVFGVSYFVINAVHSGLFISAGGPSAARAMLQLAPLNLTSAGLVLAGGFLPDIWRYVTWGAAFAVQIASPYLRPIGGFTISVPHFVERHGLVVIIALGESIVAIGVGAAGLPVDLRLVTAAILGLTLSYLMYWVYFGDGDDARAEQALSAVEPSRRAMVALRAFGWAFFVLLMGIVAVSAGVKKVIAHSADELSVRESLVLAVGMAVFLLGDVWFRLVLAIGPLRYRTVGAALALATVPFGLVFAVGQVAALIALLIAMLYLEMRGSRGRVGGDEAGQALA